MSTVNRRFSGVLAAAFALVFSLLVLPPGHADELELITVRGEVLGSDGSPLPQVKVDFMDCEESQLDLCVLTGTSLTDSHGEFSLQVEEESALRISFDADDNVHSLQYWTGQGQVPTEERNEAVSVMFGGESVQEINVQLATGASVVGVARDADANPADGAHIAVKTASGEDTLREGQAGEDGFAIGGLSAGSYLFGFTYQGNSVERAVTLSRGETVNLGSIFITDQLTNITAPTIEGYALVGETLTATPGTWSLSDLDFTYQWFVDEEAIAGATSQTYVVQPSDLDKELTVEVTASNGLASESVTSTPSDLISLPQIHVLDDPVIEGALLVGSRLTAQPGVWDPATGVHFDYQWVVDGEDVQNATENYFDVAQEHAGSSILLEVTASKAGLESAVAYSQAVTIAELITIQNVNPPSISGALHVGSTLTATTGDWSAAQGAWDPTGATFTYRWFLDEVEVTGASGHQLTLSAGAVGKRVTVAVSVSKPGYVTSSPVPSAASEPVDLVQLVNVSVPSVSGSPTVGSTLKASTGSWNESGVSYTYRWYADGVLISGATKASFKLTSAQAGKRITAGVAVTKAGFKGSVRVQSSQTARVLHTSVVTVKTKNKKKRKVDFTVTVKSNKKNANGYVELYRGSKRIKTVKLAKGKATIKLTGQPVGKHKYTFKYVGWGTAKPASKSVTITTKK